MVISVCFLYFLPGRRPEPPGLPPERFGPRLSGRELPPLRLGPLLLRALSEPERVLLGLSEPERSPLGLSLRGLLGLSDPERSPLGFSLRGLLGLSEPERSPLGLSLRGLLGLSDSARSPRGLRSPVGLPLPFVFRRADVFFWPTLLVPRVPVFFRRKPVAVSSRLNLAGSINGFS